MVAVLVLAIPDAEIPELDTGSLERAKLVDGDEAEVASFARPAENMVGPQVFLLSISNATTTTATDKVFLYEFLDLRGERGETKRL